MGSSAPVIYQIREITTGRVYVGSTVNFPRRKIDHLRLLKRGKHHSYLLQKSWEEHGENDFTFDIIEMVPSQCDLFDREQHWIDTLHACDPICGFNIATIAGTILAKKGEAHYKARLTWENVHEIRRLRGENQTYKSIGDMFSVDADTIRDICLNITWRVKDKNGEYPEYRKRKLDMPRKYIKTEGGKGERHHRTHLTWEDVRLIRKIRKEVRVSYREIGEQFDIDADTARDICRYVTWKNDPVVDGTTSLAGSYGHPK